jgi:hypothetical protein
LDLRSAADGVDEVRDEDEGDGDERGVDGDESEESNGVQVAEGEERSYRKSSLGGMHKWAV